MTKSLCLLGDASDGRQRRRRDGGARERGRVVLWQQRCVGVLKAVHGSVISWLPGSESSQKSSPHWMFRLGNPPGTQATAPPACLLESSSPFTPSPPCAPRAKMNNNHENTNKILRKQHTRGRSSSAGAGTGQPRSGTWRRGAASLPSGVTKTACAF